MSSKAVTEALIDAIESNYDLIVTNYANPDMVGHTGNLDAAIQACEAVDKGIGRLVGALKKVDGASSVSHGLVRYNWTVGTVDDEYRDDYDDRDGDRYGDGDYESDKNDE